MKQIKQSSHNAIYGIIGMFGILLCGIAVGFIINGSSRINTSSMMSEKQCQDLSARIINAADNNNPELLRQLNEIFSENCNNRRFGKPHVKPVKNTVVKPVQMHQDVNVCNRIERVWLDRLNELEIQNDEVVVGEPDAQFYINRAKIYANLADRGCKENLEVYKELAKKDLEVARALNQDRLDDRREATEMVETYKRLQMQNEAAKMIEKAKKLTNPAIDFIIQLEKIIEE